VASPGRGTRSEGHAHKHPEQVSRLLDQHLFFLQFPSFFRRSELLWRWLLAIKPSLRHDVEQSMEATANLSQTAQQDVENMAKEMACLLHLDAFGKEGQ